MMRKSRLIWRSLVYYFPRHVLVALGVALSTAILTGALFIGDSMRHSLEQITLSRLGNTTHLISVTDRYFRADLASEIGKAAGVPAVPLLALDGMAVARGGEARINHLSVYGIDDRFRAIFPDIPLPEGDQILLSENAALQLGVGPGDDLLVRVAKASLVPRNTPFVSENETTVTLRATVTAVLSTQGAGLFNLRNAQSAPRNLFLSLGRLNDLMELEERANQILIPGNPSTDLLDSLLQRSLTPADAGLHLREIPATGELEIFSERIFLERETAEAFASLPGSRAIMTYFVNAISAGGKEVPYSFASSVPGAGLTPGEILISDWVAGDLGVGEGDSLRMEWYEIGPLRQLTAKSRPFRVATVVPLSGMWADSTLMPAIPGMADAGHCREWEAGVPVDLSRIRPRDEAYWNRYRGTPKVFVAPELAQEIWANRFGDYTSVRIPAERFSESGFLRIFREKLTPAVFGFEVAEVREKGLQSARGGVDFGQLFLGLSFFLLLAAVLLTALLFRFNIENRASQVGTLLQLGFSRHKTTTLLLAEAALVALVGVSAGLILAVGYVKVIFAFLNTLWWDIVRTPVIFLHVGLPTLVAGGVASLAVALLSIWFPLRSALRRGVADLHRQQEKVSATKPSLLKRGLPLLLAFPAVLLVSLQLTGMISSDPLLFFLSGGLLLGAFVAAFALLLPRFEGGPPQSDPGAMPQQVKSPEFIHSEFTQSEPTQPELTKPEPTSPELTMPMLALRMAARHRRRSAAVYLLFALGTFMVVATGANRLNTYSRAGDPSSGTGGFSAWAELAVPLLYDLNDSARRSTAGLQTPFSAVHFSRVAGDDASCLNLNKIDNPSILGVDPSLLEGRFSFTTRTEELDPELPWSSLQKTLPGGVVPGVADQTVIQWGLMMKTGDTLLYRGETGDTLRIRLVGGLAPSIFQGSVLIADTHFYRYFPSHSGSGVFLASWAPEDAERAGEEIRDLLRDQGVEMTSAPRRLAEFASVTNTYLAIFLALGVLGLLLGTVGLALVLARAILERRRELATLLALGFPRRKVVSLLFREYFFLLATGTLSGFAAALVTVIPSLSGGHHAVSAGDVTLLILLILAHGAIWIFLLARTLASPSRLLPALRDL